MGCPLHTFEFEISNLKPFMNYKGILQGGLVCAAMAGFHAQAALLPLNHASTELSSDYSDFTGSSLQISDSVTGSGSTFNGAFTAKNAVGSSQNNFTSNFDPAINTRPPGGVGFTGQFSLTATIMDNLADGQYEVKSGSFFIDGNLTGGTSSTLLLQGTLKTGKNSLGYTDGTGNEFDFLFNVTTGDPRILKDFFGNTSDGAILMTTSTTYSGITSSFLNKPGQADAFVPEPRAFGLAGSALALLGLSLNHKKRRVLRL
jgi:hypothetical protein